MEFHNHLQPSKSSTHGQDFKFRQVSTSVDAYLHILYTPFYHQPSENGILYLAKSYNRQLLVILRTIIIIIL